MTNSEKWFERAQRILPGGVNSPVRAFAAVGGQPLFIRSARGAYLQTEDGLKMVDFCQSWGASLLGHAPAPVVAATQKALRDGLSFGACHKAEVELAETLRAAIPPLERVRLVNSGTEATMTAIRLARGHTGRDLILKFAGCYHGHCDALLISAGSGPLTLSRPSSDGVPAGLARDTRVAPFNNLEAVTAIVKKYGAHLAAIIVEPVPANMGVVLPHPGFLQGLQKLARQCGALLIFDEVITGFRFCFGGYQKLCGVNPDLTCLGKIIGGGLPLAALGGSRKIMDKLAPLGGVYQAGTLSGNPVAVAAGRAVLSAIEKQPPYPTLENLGASLADRLIKLKGFAARFSLARLGALFTIYCRPSVPQNLDEVKESDTARFARLHAFFLARGIYLPPAQFEACFLCAQHTPAHSARFVRTFAEFIEYEEAD